MRSQIHAGETHGLLSNGLRVGRVTARNLAGTEAVPVVIDFSGYFNTGDTVTMEWTLDTVAQPDVVYTVAAGANRFFDWNDAATAFAAVVDAELDLVAAAPLGATGVVNVLAAAAGDIVVTGLTYVRLASLDRAM